MSESATERLAAYAAGLGLADLPEPVRQQSGIILSDTVGVLVAASRSTAVQLLIGSLLPARSGSEATVIGAPTRTSADFAAFVNGVGGHNIELDDSHGPSRTHAASVIVPACLAAAELAGDRTVADLLVGIVAAYDVQARMSKAAGVQEMFGRGFHPSAVAGAVGAAAAAASLLRLPADTTAVALGLAASQSSGLLSFEEDPSHMMKSLQTGVAARNGVLAAVLAAAGFQGPMDTLAGPHSAIRAFGGEMANPDLLLAELGSRHEVTGTSIKRHACCGQTHAAVDGLLEIMAAESLRPDEIDHIATEISVPAVPIVDGNPLWTHNIQYIMALTAHQGRVGPEHFGQPWISDPAILKLAGHVTVAGSEELTTRFPAAKGANVEVTARGTTFRGHVPAPVGHPSVPLTPATLHDKFVALAEPSLPDGRAEQLFQALQDETTPVSELAATFRALRSPA